MPSIDGIRLDGFELGRVYELGTSLAALFLAERWGEPALEARTDTPELLVRPLPLPPKTRPSSLKNPGNLIREIQPPYPDYLARAADPRHRSRKRR